MKLTAGTVEKPEDNKQGDSKHPEKAITIDMAGSTESSKPASDGLLGLLSSRPQECRQPPGCLLLTFFFLLYWAVIVWCVAVTPSW